MLKTRDIVTGPAFGVNKGNRTFTDKMTAAYRFGGAPLWLDFKLPGFYGRQFRYFNATILRAFPFAGYASSASVDMVYPIGPTSWLF